jgi:hypothetical protein
MTKKIETDTDLAIDTDVDTEEKPKVAEAIVGVEVVLPVLILVGKQELSVDDAIDRLAQIQLEERVLKKEKEPMRDALKGTLRECRVRTHTTPNGASATLNEQVRCNADKKYLKSILTEDQYDLAFPPTIVKGMKITA